jgi:ABC-2 type transport system permease protein
MIVAMSLVPLLFIEEQESHTLDALLVSPASFGQMVAGKALAGIVYCLLAVTGIVLLNTSQVIHWGVLLLACILGTLFCVMVGLLLGLMLDNSASLNLWSGILIMLLAAPALIVSLNPGRLSPALKTVMAWLPPTAMTRLFMISLSGEYPAGQLLFNCLLLTAASLVIFAAALWRIRKMDR